MQKTLAFASRIPIALGRGIRWLIFYKLMKISFYSFIIALITAQSLTAEISKAQDIKEVQITFGVRNVTLKYALNKLQKESGYNVFYLSPKVTPYRDISIPVETRSVQETLELILQKTSFSYRQEGKTIILLDNKGRRVENTFHSDSQTNLLKQVRGRVTDENGNGLPGVNIVIKGSQRGFITDTDGRFMIDITDENTVLIFSFVGYMTEEIIVGNQTSIDLTMRVDPKNLSELVVVGYGVQKKSDLTGAVASVPMQFVKDQPVRGIADILQGRVPGMTLSRTSGQVGASTKIRIRGANSILGDNEPLYVVDGIIGGSIGSVHDIESIEILKDASATAIYGERASNGVILVTTKRATSSKPQIRVSFNTGFSYQPTRYPDKMNAAEYAEHLNNMSPGTYTEAEIAEFRRNGGTDWMKALTRTGVKNDHYISYSQKVNQVGVYLSARYLDETGTMKNSKIGGNYQIRANIDFKPSDKLSFNFDLRANRNTQQNGTLSTGTSKEDPLFQALIWSPTEPIWDDEENGIYHTHDRFGALWVNPYMRIMEQQTLSKSHGIYTNLVAEYKITNWLTYHVTGFARQSASSSANYDNAWINPTDPTSTRSANESSAWRLINRLDFNKTFQNAHNIAATVVYETEASESWGLNGLGRNMPLPDLAEYYNIGLSNLQTASSSFGKSSRIGYLGRVNYNFKSRYIFTASYRIDGKSGPTDRIEENKYGAFPSFGLAWNITEEPFINDRVFQNLKIRLGWGKTGNPSGFPYTRMVSKNYSFGVGSASLGYAPGTPANPHDGKKRHKPMSVWISLS